MICACHVKSRSQSEKKNVDSGGLTSLLMLLRSFEDETVRRVAAGAIANLAMNGNFAFIFFLMFETSGAFVLYFYFNHYCISICSLKYIIF